VHYVTKCRHSSFDYYNFYSGMPGWNSLGGPYLPHLPYASLSEIEAGLMLGIISKYMLYWWK